MRCYNGCPDDEMQAMLNRIEALKKEVRKFEPEAHVTFHAPHGGSAGGCVVHVWGRELSGYHPSTEAALQDALTRR